MALNKKGHLPGIIFSKATLVVLMVLCAFMAVSVFKRYTVERDMAERRYAVESEYHELETRRDSLLERVNYLKGDSGRESEVRKHFDVAREGEQVVIIVDDADEEKQAPAPESLSTTDEYPWWQFWR